MKRAGKEKVINPLNNTLMLCCGKDNYEYMEKKSDGFPCPEK
jgi:hypothetical protein